MAGYVHPQTRARVWRASSGVRTVLVPHEPVTRVPEPRTPVAPIDITREQADYNQATLANEIRAWKHSLLVRGLQMQTHVLRNKTA